jgi:magnesium transporter
MLINCAAYQDGKKLADIPVSQIHLFVNEPGCFVWVALKDPEPEELDVMRKEFELHELAVEDAHHGHQRPKIEVWPVAVRRDADGGNGGEGLNVGRWYLRQEEYVLSVRHRARQGFTDVRKRCETEPELLSHGSAYVLYALMDAVVDRYFPCSMRFRSSWNKSRSAFSPNKPSGRASKRCTASSRN